MATNLCSSSHQEMESVSSFLDSGLFWFAFNQQNVAEAMLYDFQASASRGFAVSTLILLESRDYHAVNPKLWKGPVSPAIWVRPQAWMWGHFSRSCLCWTLSWMETQKSKQDHKGTSLSTTESWEIIAVWF